jgi:hypothetical protein
MFCVKQVKTDRKFERFYESWKQFRPGASLCSGTKLQVVVYCYGDFGDEVITNNMNWAFKMA